METQTRRHLSDVTVKPEVDRVTVTVQWESSNYFFTSGVLKQLETKKLDPSVPARTEAKPELCNYITTLAAAVA